MATQTATDVAEQLRTDGHTVSVTSDDSIVRIEEQGDSVGVTDIPLGWGIVMIHEGGEIHLMEK